jgi:hypothetical protein
MQTINIVRNIDTNVIEFINGIGQFVDINADFFTIDIATTEWQLPTDGFPKSYLEGITLEIETSEGIIANQSKLNGTAGNYSIEL